MPRKELLLEMSNITKSYAGVTVLRNMDFCLNEGEVHCIVGENGAGKSTFIKILSGAIKPDYGTINAFGQRWDFSDPRLPITIGISTIYQDTDLVETLTVVDNIFLGEEHTAAGFVQRKQQLDAAQQLLDELNLDISPRDMVEDITPAQKQMLLIAKALQRKARIIIMDEPTASLGESESQMLMNTVKTLAKKGMGVIYISHYLEEIFELADTISVIKDGNLVGCYEAARVTREDIVSAMVGRESSLFFERERFEVGEELLRVENMTNLPMVNNISFILRKGEILGIGGLVGSGRTELMRLIYGVDKRQSGRIFLRGQEVTITSPRQAISNGICMLGEDRKGDGMFLNRSVLENVCVVRNERKIVISQKADKSATEQMVKRLNLKLQGVDQEIERLSGGNQQKCIVARWMLSSCDIIIFDEPTKGVDIGAREEIYKLMVAMAKSGKAIIMVSSDMPEILSISDRICILREGKLVHTTTPADLTEEKLMSLYLGIA